MSDAVYRYRGEGTEIRGMRITVYNLVPGFLDPTVTESSICEFYELSPEEVAAARAYVLANFDAVMARHRHFEEERSRPTPPEILAISARVRPRMQKYREWMAERDAANQKNGSGSDLVQPFPTFEQWLAVHVGSGCQVEENLNEGAPH